MAKRIVIADDEPTIVALTKQKLEEQGYIVDTARNGREALEIIKTTSVQLIVTDVVMPIMDGVDLYKELKKDPHLSSIPIVIVTDNRIFRESFQTLGVEHFVPKPLDPQQLIHKVEYVFMCEDLDKRNKHVLILGGDAEANAGMAKILTGQGLVVGKSTDPIDFINACLILSPQAVFIDIAAKGDIQPKEIVKALRAFSRLRGVRVLTYTQFGPESIGTPEGIEQLRQAKDDCQEAGATRYIGRFTPATFWDMVKEFVV